MPKIERTSKNLLALFFFAISTKSDAQEDFVRHSLTNIAKKMARIKNLNSTSNSPMAPLRLSCQISANQREAETSAKITTNICYQISATACSPC